MICTVDPPAKSLYMMAMARQRMHYAWVVAATTFVVLLVGAAIRATPSVLMKPLERDFGWSPAIVGSAVSVNLLLYGLAGPFCAALAELVGVRRLMVMAMSLLAAAILIATQIDSAWQLILLW